MLIGWIIGLLGIWVGITPFFGAAPGFYAWSHWIVGALVAVLGFSMVARRTAAGWVSGLLGVWLFIAAFIPGLLAGAGVWWDNLLVGVVLIIVGFGATRELNRTAHTGHAHATAA